MPIRMTPYLTEQVRGGVVPFKSTPKTIKNFTTVMEKVPRQALGGGGTCIDFGGQVPTLLDQVSVQFGTGHCVSDDGILCNFQGNARLVRFGFAD